jgi:hypothetical protein
MTVSHKTVLKVLEVVMRHVDEATAKKIVKDLCSVPGNSSFRETIEQIESVLNNRRK